MSDRCDVKETLLHASSVVMGGYAVLIRGKPGLGKSDLALRLRDRGATLLADDQTRLLETDQGIVAAVPDTIAGLIEVRGLGVVPVSACSRPKAEIPVALIVELVEDPKDIDRLPEDTVCTVCGTELPFVKVYGYAASAPIVVEMALEVALGLREVTR